MDQDQASGIKGLPQRLGKAKSIVTAILLILLGVAAVMFVS
jgi:1,4-dihydroxy-2-naphthoate octaprenyltransferase